MSEKIKVLLSEEEVDARIKQVAAQISRDYAGREIHLICVLKGGVFFTCELAKRITVPVSLDFMSVSSYGDDTKSSGVVKIVKDLDLLPFQPHSSSIHYMRIWHLPDLLIPGFSQCTLYRLVLKSPTTRPESLQ